MGAEQPQGAMGKLEQLARARFGRTLTPSELKLMRAAPNGKWAQCGPSLHAQDNDPSKADTEWGADREIRADVILWLCVDEEAKREVARKGIWVLGAKISGSLDLSFAIIPFPIGLMHCRLLEGAEFVDAQLPVLSLEGSWVRWIIADRSVIKGSVYLRDGFHSEGEVRLPGARVGDRLECEQGTFINHSGIALDAAGINVGGGACLRDRFRAEGEVRLQGAQIGGDLDCEGGTFLNPTGRALTADGIKVQGGVSLRNNFRAEGEVQLVGAEIGGDLDCGRGTFVGPQGELRSYALLADRANIKGSVFLRDGFRAEGGVSLAEARIGLSLDYHSASFKEGWMDLTNAYAGSVLDDENSWPARGRLILAGFVYGEFTVDAPRDAETRLRWLALQPEKLPSPQPYRQLARVLREAGDDAGARTVLVAMEDHQRRGDLLRPVLKWSIGYGQHPLWAGWWALGFGALGWILYRRSYLAGGMVPTEKGACGEFKADGQIPKCYGRLFPSIYSLESSLPLVKLGQADKWQPDPDYIRSAGRVKPWPGRLRRLERLLVRVGLLAPVIAGGSPPRKAKWIKTAGREKPWPGWLRWLERRLMLVGLVAPVDPAESPSRLGRIATSPRFLRWFLWFQILLGWLLATLFLAGVAGLISKE